ncbi:MAG TPA: DUF2752 domain-containing protein [Flavobacteriaceae bacterium]|nr:DUF2752 domain-containing protein [Flavobacteriaceae bacterium]
MNTEGIEKYMLPCLNKKLFGIDCLGCGMQRATALLFSGDFAGAFGVYPAIYPILLLLFFVLLNLFIKIKNAFQIKIILIILTALLIVGNYFIKMKTFL